MNDDVDPPIHIITDDAKLRICFSRAMKIGIAVTTSSLGALVAGAFIFAWQSNSRLADIERSIVDNDRRITEHLEELTNRLDRYNRRLERVESAKGES